MKKLLNILFWSIIAAAFIGPGTVTTAASAGAEYKYALLWTLVFSTIACLILQEASARITVISNKNLGQALREQYTGKSTGLLVLILILGAIVLGSAAYEAGNILGGVAGAVLGTGFSKNILTLSIGLIAGLLLFFGTTSIVARIMGVVVAIMGITFIFTAFMLAPSFSEIVKGSLFPSLPKGSGILILGLIGTTVVPYNLFLGSEIAKGQNLKEFRFGLSVAIILGGIISMGVLVVGTAITDTFTFQSLSEALTSRLGNWASLLFAIGLFSAGFSSAITAPLAAAITAKSLFDNRKNDFWNEKSFPYRSIWMGVLLIGIIFGLTDFKPVEVIILAQALNGLLLPFVAVFLFVTVNDIKLMGNNGVNNIARNIVTGIVVVITILLGVSNITRAAYKIFESSNPDEGAIILISIIITILLSYPIGVTIKKRRRYYRIRD